VNPRTAAPSRLAEVRRTIVCLLSLASVAFSAFWILSRRVSSLESNGGITIVEDALDFGEVWVQESFEWTLPFCNRTGRSVEVLDVRTSCGCVRVEPSSFVLAARETVPVRFFLDLTAAGAEIGTEPLRDFSVQIVPVARSAIPGQVGWMLRGSIRSPVYVSASTIDFAENLVSGEPFEPRWVTVKCHALMQELGVECNTDLVSAELLPLVASNSAGSGRAGVPAEYELRVTPSRALPEGRFDFQIRLTGKTAEGESFPEIPIRVLGSVVSDIRSLPETIRFGTVRAGQVVEATVELCSMSGNPFAITDVSLGPHVLSVEPAASEPAVSHVVKIEYEGKGSGQQESSVSFQTRDGEGESRMVRVPITSYVVSQARVLSFGEAADSLLGERKRERN